MLELYARIRVYRSLSFRFATVRGGIWMRLCGPVTTLLCLALAMISVPNPGLASQDKYAKATDEWNQPVKPFRIIGNLYYVGASEVSSFLITTPGGHILLDSGFAETVPLIVKSIGELGFKVTDVKVLINSHAHYDHCGGFAALKRITGARLEVSFADAEQIAGGGKGDFQWGDRFRFEPATIDRALKDGDKVYLGGVTMTARLTPGHTKGCTTWTMTVVDGGKKYNVVFIGSTTAPGYKLVNNPSYPDIAQDYLNTFRLLRSIPCDVFLGPHGSFFGLGEKRLALEKGKRPNPFIDPKGYRAFIDSSERDFLNLLHQQEVQGRR
jgi:metallo-beta-lactamase class B